MHSTLAFGRVTALLTRVVQILKNRAVKEQENPCGFDVNAFSVAGRHYRLMLVELLEDKSVSRSFQTQLQFSHQ